VDHVATHNLTITVDLPLIEAQPDSHFLGVRTTQS